MTEHSKAAFDREDGRHIGDWEVGDRCVLSILPEGRVYAGTVEAIHGRLLAVLTDEGKRFHVRPDSGFVSRP